MISEYYEVFKDLTLNDLSISFSRADYELQKDLLDCGFKLIITRGQIFLESDSYKQALANMIYELAEDLIESFSTVKEYRFDYDEASMKDEIYLHYLDNYESKTLEEVVDDLKSDWIPTEDELEREQSDMSDEFESKRHPDEKEFSSPANKGKKLFNDQN